MLRINWFGWSWSMVFSQWNLSILHWPMEVQRPSFLILFGILGFYWESMLFEILGFYWCWTSLKEGDEWCWIKAVWKIRKNGLLHHASPLESGNLMVIDFLFVWNWVGNALLNKENLLVLALRVTILTQHDNMTQKQHGF